MVEPGTDGLAAVVQRFGRDILGPEGRLDRAALGALVFADDQARADLNALIHPRVRQRAAILRAEALQQNPRAVVVEVIPLLVETGQESDFDHLIVVDAPVTVQVERIKDRSGLSDAEAQARVAAQASRDERLTAATFVVDNGGDRTALDPQVDALWGVIAPSV